MISELDGTHNESVLNSKSSSDFTDEDIDDEELDDELEDLDMGLIDIDDLEEVDNQSLIEYQYQNQHLHDEEVMS